MLEVHFPCGREDNEIIYVSCRKVLCSSQHHVGQSLKTFRRVSCSIWQDSVLIKSLTASKRSVWPALLIQFYLEEGLAQIQSSDELGSSCFLQDETHIARRIFISYSNSIYLPQVGTYPDTIVLFSHADNWGRIW